MTCIVGLETEHGVWLGADSFSGNPDWRGVADPRRKIVEIAPDLHVGLAGSWALREVLMTAPCPERVDCDERTLFRFVNAWRDKAHDLGCASFSEGQAMTPNKGLASALIAYRGRLWSMTGGWSLVKPVRPFEAIGAAFYYAEGALAATSGLLPAEERVQAALTAAAELCPTASRPFFAFFQARS